MKIKEITQFLESLAPLDYQESYDNSGLIIGNGEQEVTGILVCLDSTEAVVAEAVRKGCNMVIAHHPIVFSGLKRFNGSNYIERVVMQAIKADVAVYAIHTNLDNVTGGVNAKISSLLGLKHTRILAPKKTLRKLVTFAPLKNAGAVRTALANAGTGTIGQYSECSFSVAGNGRYKASAAANPVLGKKNELHTEPEERIEVIYPQHLERQLVQELKNVHPYEEVAYDLFDLQNNNAEIGSGMIGTLPEAMGAMDFLKQLKTVFKTACVRHTAPVSETVKTIAVCGGSGSFLLEQAVRAAADVFITGDYKYHQFFDADGRIVIADVGHYESEQFTIDLLADLLKEKFSKFAVHLTEVNTNPINYL